MDDVSTKTLVLLIVVTIVIIALSSWTIVNELQSTSVPISSTSSSEGIIHIEIENAQLELSAPTSIEVDTR